MLETGISSYSAGAAGAGEPGVVVVAAAEAPVPEVPACFSTSSYWCQLVYQEDMDGETPRPAQSHPGDHAVDMILSHKKGRSWDAGLRGTEGAAALPMATLVFPLTLHVAGRRHHTP